MKHSMDSIINQRGQDPSQPQNQPSTSTSASTGGNGSIPLISSRGYYLQEFYPYDVRHSVPFSYLSGVAQGQPASYFPGVPQGQPPTYPPNIQQPYALHSPRVHPVAQNLSTPNSAMPARSTSVNHEIPVFTFNQTVTLLKKVWQASRFPPDQSYNNYRGRRRGQGRNRQNPYNENYYDNNNYYYNQ